MDQDPYLTLDIFFCLRNNVVVKLCFDWKDNDRIEKRGRIRVSGSVKPNCAPPNLPRYGDTGIVVLFILNYDLYMNLCVVGSHRQETSC